MSEVNLLVFGCAVSFIAVAGAYVYIRECFTGQAQPQRKTARRAEAPDWKRRKVA